MTKEELETLLNSLNITVNEGIFSDKNTSKIPRLVFWDYVWEQNTASGKKYKDKVTYQISFFANIPRHPKIIELKNKLGELGLFPTISIEYVDEEKIWHSYFALEVMENV